MLSVTNEPEKLIWVHSQLVIRPTEVGAYLLLIEIIHFEANFTDSTMRNTKESMLHQDEANCTK